MAKQALETTPWIYFAGPLFTAGEIAFNQKLADGLRQQGYKIYLPQEECAGALDPQTLYDICIRGLDGAGMVLIILDGTDADSGSCFEMGYAVAKGLAIVGLRTDFRGSGEHMGLNLMLTHSCTHLFITKMVPEEIPDTKTPVTVLGVGSDPLPYLLEVFAKLPTAQAAR